MIQNIVTAIQRPTKGIGSILMAKRETDRCLFWPKHSVNQGEWLDRCEWHEGVFYVSLVDLRLHGHHLSDGIYPLTVLYQGATVLGYDERDILTVQASKLYLPRKGRSPTDLWAALKEAPAH